MIVIAAWNGLEFSNGSLHALIAEESEQRRNNEKLVMNLLYGYRKLILPSRHPSDGCTVGLHIPVDMN